MKQYRNVNSNWGDSIVATFDEFQKQAILNGTVIKTAIRNGCDVIIDFDDEVIAVSVDDYNDSQAW